MIWYDGALGKKFDRVDEQELYDEMRADFEERDVRTHSGKLGPSDTGEKSGREKLFFVRAVDRDVSFLRQFLTPILMRRLNLFEFVPKDETYVISHVSDQDGWRAVKETLLKNTGMGSVPVIKIEDADYDHNRVLYLKHYFEGRELLNEYVEKTLRYVQQLWGQSVKLETVLGGKRQVYGVGADKAWSSKTL